MTAAKPQADDVSAEALAKAEAAAKAEAPQGDAFTAELPAKVFAAAMARLAALAPDRATIPIVQHALLRFAGKGALTLAATNLDQALAVTVKAKGAGAITASAARLAAIAQLLDESSPVKLKRTETGLTVSQGRATWRLPTLPAEDFPATLVEPLPEAVTWVVPAATVIAQLKEIEGAIEPPGGARPYLEGAFFDLAAEVPGLCATDGHRLACAELAGLRPPEAPSFILPRQALRPLAEMAKAGDGKGGGDLTLGLARNGLTAGAGDVFFRTKLIEGDFPDWRRLLPPEFGWRLRFEAAELRRAIERVGLIEGDAAAGGKGKTRVTAIRIEVAEGEATLSSRNGLGEEASAVCPYTWAGEPAQKMPDPVGFNATYLSWAVASLGEARQVDMCLQAGMPVVFLRSDDEARESQRLVMPMRV